MILDFIKFEMWPWIKVKFIYWWWIAKYRGKNNIPPELIFQKLTENAESLTKNIMDAVRSSPENEITAEEREQMRDILMKVSNFQREIKNLNEKNNSK